MNFEIVIEQKAIDEIVEDAKWYSEKSSIATENFEKEINEAFKYLQFTITEHRKVLADIRILPLKIFPYNIYYLKKETEKKVYIMAILHNKRNTDFIKKRLEI